MAVFTSGELAMASATTLAEASETAPRTATWISFCAPSPSRTTCRASSCSSPASASRNPARISPPSAGTSGCSACPVAKSSTVSEVEVSLSTVVQLKEVSTPAFSADCSAAAGIFASVATKQSIVAMSGAIMPDPLAMPVMVTGAPPMLA